ncbi:MAG: TatD family hydrolase [Bacteroidota bacterium]
MYIDSHTHLYLEDFDNDREEVVERALETGVEKFLLPNIDSGSVDRMMKMTKSYPGVCYPMIGLHPGSVNEKFHNELEGLRNRLSERVFCAIGEVGIDLYWEKKFKEEQEQVFKTQIHWAKEMQLPLVIHSRESFWEIFKILDSEMDDDLRGVFHSFTGGKEELEKVLEYGFYFGINGIATFKNSNLSEIIKQIPEDKLLLETDSPYLAPVPKRGKRNESSYMPYIAEVVAEIKGKSRDHIAGTTRENAIGLFNLD